MGRLVLSWITPWQWIGRTGRHAVVGVVKKAGRKKEEEPGTRI
jgi:hypothetical protein